MRWPSWSSASWLLLFLLEFPHERRDLPPLGRREIALLALSEDREQVRDAPARQVEVVDARAAAHAAAEGSLRFTRPYYHVAILLSSNRSRARVPRQRGPEP